MCVWFCWPLIAFVTGIKHLIMYTFSWSLDICNIYFKDVVYTLYLPCKANKLNNNTSKNKLCYVSN